MTNAKYDAEVIVCVTAQLECERLIQIGKTVAGDDARLQVLSVQPENQEAEARAKDLGNLFEIAKKAGAEIAIYYNDSPVLMAAAHIRRCHAKEIITGFPEAETTNHFVDMLRALMPDVRITMVRKDGVLHVMEPASVAVSK